MGVGKMVSGFSHVGKKLALIVDDLGHLIVTKKDVEPKHLITIPYTEFVAGGTVSSFFPKALSRKATRRAFIFYNTMDVALTAQRFTMNDSFFVETSRTAGATATTSNVVANNSCIQIIDASSTFLSGSMGEMLNSPVDSISISVTIGTTAPVRGELSIAVIEVEGS